MIEWGELWTQSIECIVQGANELRLRTGISAAYYSLFHRLTSAGAASVAGADPALRQQVARAYDHSTMARLCEAYSRPPQAKQQSALDRLIPQRSQHILIVCRQFPLLQVARHRVDYVLSDTISIDEAFDLSDAAARAHEAWSAAATSPEAATFLTALLLHDKWTRRG